MCGNEALNEKPLSRSVTLCSLVSITYAASTCFSFPVTMKARNEHTLYLSSPFLFPMIPEALGNLSSADNSTHTKCSKEIAGVEVSQP